MKFCIDIMVGSVLAGRCGCGCDDHGRYGNLQGARNYGASLFTT